MAAGLPCLISQFTLSRQPPYRSLLHPSLQVNANNQVKEYS